MGLVHDTLKPALLRPTLVRPRLVRPRKKFGARAKRKEFIVSFQNKAQKKFKAIMDALKASFKKDLKALQAKLGKPPKEGGLTAKDLSNMLLEKARLFLYLGACQR